MAGIAPQPRRGVLESALCALGVCGAIACSFAMFAVPLGIVGVGTAAAAKGASSMQGMAGMGSMGDISASSTAHLPVWLDVLNHFGPQLLIASVMLIVVALALRRAPFAATVALIGGIVLYYGMYLQANMLAMESGTVAGLGMLISAMFGLRRREISATGTTHTTSGCG